MLDEGKCIIFELNNESYAVPARYITGVSEMLDFTRVPHAPAHILGVINLKGKIVPLINLRKKLGLEENAQMSKACILITSFMKTGKAKTAGVVVDAVSEFLEALPGEIANFRKYAESPFLLGTGVLDGKKLRFLDLENIVSNDVIFDINSFFQEDAK